MASAVVKEYHLGGDVYLVAKDFKGQRVVHIRAYGKKADGTKFPTKKGICMSPSAYSNLINSLDLVQSTYNYVDVGY